MKRLIALALCLVVLPAAAHSGHVTAHGFGAGLAHPFVGIDHLLAMLGIGLWSRRQQQPWTLPLVFVTMMAAGALLPGAVPVSDVWIAATVVMVGLLLVAVRLPAWSAIMVVGLFALLHGQVHGHELPGLWSAAGYLSASAILLAAGSLAGVPRAFARGT